MSKVQDRANSIPWPPIIFAVYACAAWALETAVPIHVTAVAQLRWPGAALALAGLAIALAGAGYFKTIGTPVNPVGTPLKLATGGIYRFTRNPMYLGECVMFAGFGLALASAWLVLLVPLVAVALRQLAILPEEAYLTRRFGDCYRDYCARVRRWI